MDFDGLVCSSNNIDENKQKFYGSGLRPVGYDDEFRRDLKVAKIDDDGFSSASASKAMQQRSPLLRSNTSLLSDGQQMLSFSSPNNTQTVTFPYYYHHNTSGSYGRNTGYGSVGGLNTASMHGVLTGVRGPFTPSQWMELEHQALIYKYITANAPIPSNLLIPIRKALESAGFSGFSGGYLRHNALGWGAFPLGFSNNTDPEPGRCRRTDGKKWRCSRDAVPEQKYCERHMNRGRHRSRKPVEGQNGHSVSGTTNAKQMPMSSSASAAAATVGAGGGSSNGIGLSHHHHQLSNLQPGASNPSASPHLNRGFLNKANASEKIQETTGLSMLSPTIGLKENQFSLPKHQNLYEESSRMEFGLVCSDSLLNPLHKSSPLINCRNYASSEEINDPETKSQHNLRQFMDDWPKSQSKHSPIFWPDIDTQSDRTQLSISIPMASSDFMSSTSSPTNEKLALSPLRLSRELDSTQMGLGMGTALDEPSQRQANWVPISWGNSMGGPLGEVLHSTTNSLGECSNTSALNLMTEGWDSSPRIGSSPTGVLQKATFRSLSNSSAGSSPRTEHAKGHEGGASICNNLLGSTLINSTMPAL